MSRSNWLLYSTALVSVATIAGADTVGSPTLSFVDISRGSYDGISYTFAAGSVLAPMSSGATFQFDAMLGELDGEPTLGLGIHLFYDISTDVRIGFYADTARTEAGGGIAQQRLGLEGQLDTEFFQFFGILGRQYGDFAEGSFGSFSTSFYPNDSLGLFLTHSFQPGAISDVTSIGFEQRFDSGRHAIALFGDAGYVHDDDDWAVSAGIRIYFGGASNRDFVTQGSVGNRNRPMPQHFDLFMQAASEATRAFEDGLIE